MKRKVLSVFIIPMFWGLSLSAQNVQVVKDIDENEYVIITIGNQNWMAENLKVTRYNDGEPIPYVTDDDEWWSLKTPAYSWIDNDSDKYKNRYGALYNWYAVDSGKLCPIGWKVPTDSDWQELIEYLGGEDIAGDKLKAQGAGYWRGSNINATNEAGFNAIAGGLRYYRGFYTTGINVTWWSSTEFSLSNAWYRTIDYKFSSVERYYFIKSTGFSVRCIKHNHSIKK